MSVPESCPAPHGAWAWLATVGILLVTLVGLVTRADAQTAQHAWRTEDLSFDGRNAQLSGTLYLPEGPGPHPVMVGVHGSGRIDRSDLYQTEAAHFFSTRGVAFFMYDKRGVGASSGSYPGSYSSSMVIYAMDALAAVDRLGSHPEIDRSRIGFWGVSQAGWIIPLAASLDQDAIAFTIIISGPTVSIQEENAYSDLTGQTQGVPLEASEKEIDRALGLVESKGLDASVFIAELKRPALWIYGSLDQSVPWRQGVADLIELRDQWDRNFTWKVFEGANHGLRSARTGGSWERPTPRSPVDGFFEFQARWLRSEVGIAIDEGDAGH